jgi:L-malate glycosyltransferase
VSLKSSVVLVSEYPPPAAGMTVLAQELYSRLASEGYPISPVRTNPQLGMFSFIDKVKVVRSLFKWLIFIINCRKIITADVLHIFSSSGLNFYLFSIPPIIIARFSKTKVIINYHGGAAKEFFSRHPKLLSFAMKRVDALVVPSGYLKKVFSDFGYDSEIISNIANIERFSYKKREQIRPVIFSARNLTTVYNIQCAIRAFKIVSDKYPDAKLYVAGSGPEENDIKKLISDLNLSNVSLLGNVANNEMPDYFNKADIFINTSNVDNMPGSIIEAFASGLPVVSTNVGGIPYMVEDGVSGLLANKNDHQLLATHILSLLDNPKLVADLTAKGSEYIDTLKWNKIRSDWLDLYKKLAL